MRKRGWPARADADRVAGRLLGAVVLVVLTLAVYWVLTEPRDTPDGPPNTQPGGGYVPDELRTLLRFVDGMATRDMPPLGYELTAAGSGTSARHLM